MSKLSFRARALDASKPLPIYHSDEIPDSADCSLINRAVPQMPTGMEKEEESEHHLQRAICAGSVIPTPEVYELEDLLYYNKLYPEDYKMPRQLIYMQPFTMEADIPDYDMDSEDEVWVNSQAGKLELTPEKFEEMMDRLEKGSGQTVVTLQEAKALIKEDDDLIIAVYDYWLNKRLKTQHPLIPQVRTEARFGVSNHNPYIAFRRRTEKMQTRKNRKNDESSYEKMLKLKRDLTRAVTLLEMVKRREKSKRELLHLTIEVFEKRFQAGDFSGQMMNDALSARPARPAFTPLFQPNSLSWGKDDNLISALTRKEKRHYKKRRHKSSTKTQASSSVVSSGSALGYAASQGLGTAGGDGEFISSDEEVTAQGSPSDEEDEDEGPYVFRRKKDCNYHAPADSASWPWEEGVRSDKRFKFYQTSISNPHGPGYRRIGYARRRVGRGGRIILDRMSYTNEDDFWRSVGYTVMDSKSSSANSNKVNSNPSVGFASQTPEPNGFYPKLRGLVSNSLNVPASSNAYKEEQKCLHFRPKTPELRPENSLLATAEVVASDDDLEIEDCFQNPATEESAPALGPYLGAVVSKGELPLIFDTRHLLEDPVVYNDTAPLDAPSSNDLVLLDEQSSELSHAYYLLNCQNPGESELSRGWLGDSDFENPWLSSPCPSLLTDNMDLTEGMIVDAPPTDSSTSTDQSNSTKPKSEPPPSLPENRKRGPPRYNSNSRDDGNDSFLQPPPPADPPENRGAVVNEDPMDVEIVNVEEEIETVIASGELNFIVEHNMNNNSDSSNSEEKRRTSVDKDDKENNDRIPSIRDRGGGGGGGGGGGFVENGDSVNSTSSVDSSSLIEECVIVDNETSSRTPTNNNIINVNSSRSSSTFQLVVDSSGLGTVVGEGLETSNSLVAKGVGVVVGDSNNSSAPSNKPRTNGLQLVNMKNYGGSPEKFCHIVT
ncbi:unnamed protein product [Allacma fusca]|uniref:Enhancer of polycomb-like protein n=1 Tax=Allacma fusca TaxID=39272 RepID=A0A8J2PM76_9HEXA|nr:unnamed protein product [Allacma fusca]